MLLPLAIGAALFLGACSNDSTGYRSVSRYQATVQVQRGPEMQPRIKVLKAASALDADLALFEMQGFVQADDRFFQMDLVRRSSTGTMAELFGERARPRDLRQIGAGLRLAADRNRERIQNDFPKTWQTLLAFSEGVNRYLDNIEKLNPELLRRYRQIAGDPDYRPRRWTPTDSIAVSLSVSFYLSSSMEEKLALGGIAATFYFPDERRPQFNELFDLRPLWPAYIMDQSDAKPKPWKVVRGGAVPGAAVAAAPVRDPLLVDFGCLAGGFPFSPCYRSVSVGSNNWVMSKAFTKNDMSFLANDPHLPLTSPMTLYEQSLDSRTLGKGTFLFAGFNLPGLPGGLAGHTADFALGLTNLPADVDEVYIERLSPDSKSVMFKGKWVPLDYIEYVYEQRSFDTSGAADVKRETIRLPIVPHHGPIFSDLVVDKPAFTMGIKKLRVLIGNAALSYKWTGHMGTAELPALLEGYSARSLEDFEKAVRGRFDAGAQNMVLLDKLGNIQYIGTAKFPIRPKATANWPPFIPQEGTGEAEWEGFRPLDSVPGMKNPRDGLIVTANNDVYGHSGERNFANFTDYFGYAFSSGSRAQRIRDRLTEIRNDRGQIDLQDVQATQYDHYDLTFLKFRELLDAAGDEIKLPGAAGKTPQDLKRFADTLKILKSFSGDMNRKKSEPVFADLFLKEVIKAYWTRNPKRMRFKLPEGGSGLIFVAKTSYNRLNDGLTSADRVVKNDTLAILSRAVEETGNRAMNDGLEGVLWGQRHQVRFINMFDHVMPAPFVAPLERSGSLDVVDVAGPGYGPNFRTIYQLKDGEFEAWTSVPGGNYDTVNTGQWLKEMNRWNDGGLRRLVKLP